MNTRSPCLVLACACLGLLPPTSLRAELPPGAYAQLKKEAQEVFQLRIQQVKRTKNPGPDIQGFVCQAEILAVERSKAGHKKGDQIRFRSYYVPPSAWRNGFSGPQSPPLLQPGWQGRVYRSSHVAIRMAQHAESV